MFHLLLLLLKTDHMGLNLDCQGVNSCRMVGQGCSMCTFFRKSLEFLRQTNPIRMELRSLGCATICLEEIQVRRHLEDPW